MEYKGHEGSLMSNTFYYTVKYKTITKLLFTNVQNSRLYYIFFGYKQKKNSLFRVHSFNTKIWMSHINNCTLQLQCIEHCHLRLAVKCSPDLGPIVEKRFLRNTQTTLWHFIFFIVLFLHLWYLFYSSSSESLSTFPFKLTLYLESIQLQVKCEYKYRSIY